MKMIRPHSESVGTPVAATPTVTVYPIKPVQPAKSVAVTMKLNTPAVVGVPVMAPVAPLSASPVGRAPLVMAYVYGAVPPEAVTVWL